MRPYGLQANDAPPRDMSPSPVRPTCLGQHLSADAEGDVQREESSSNRSAVGNTDEAQDIAEVQSADSSAEGCSKRVEFAADLVEVIEIRARGKSRSLKYGTTPQCLRMVKGTEVSKPQGEDGKASSISKSQRSEPASASPVDSDFGGFERTQKGPIRVRSNLAFGAGKSYGGSRPPNCITQQ